MKLLKNLFWNVDENRLRALWRILVFLVIAAIIVNPIVIVLDQIFEISLHQTAINLIVALGFFISLSIVAKYIEKGSLPEYGLSFSYTSFTHFLQGTLVGGILISIVVLLSWLLGLISIQSTFYTHPESNTFFLVLLFGQFVRYFFGSFFEELLSRAYLIKNISEGIRNRTLRNQRAILISAVFTSLLFSVLHVFNPDFSTLSTINLFLVGLLFAFSYIYSGDLSWPIGIHFGWNIFQNVVFGYPNSGKATEVAILKFNLHKSELLNGGNFGLEASLLSTLVLIFALIGLFLLVRKTNPSFEHKLSLFKST